MRQILLRLRNATRAAWSIAVVFGLLFSVARAQDPAANSGTRVKPELVIQTGHTSLVNSVAFSPDGKILASGGGDNAVRIWDAESGRQIKALIGHTSYILAVAFSPVGEMLASGGFDNTVRLWNPATGKQIHSLEGHTGGIFSLAFSPSGKTVASGSKDNTIKIWDVQTGKQVKSLAGHTGYVFSVAFSPDGKMLASGSPDGTIRLWDLETGNARVLEAHAQEVWSVAFSSDQKTLASANTDGTLKVWDLATGNQIKSIDAHSSILYSVAFSPDGKMLVSGGADNTIKLWDVETAKEIRAFKGHTSVIKSLAFSKDGSTLLSGSSDNTIRLWNVTSGREQRSLTSRATHVLAIAVSNDGKLLATVNFNNTIKVWNVEAGQQVRSLEYGAKGVNNINAIAFSPDGNTLASAQKDETIRLWDVKTGETLKILEGALSKASQDANKTRKQATGDASTLNVTGKWSMKVESQGLSIPVALELTQDGENLKGVFSSHAGGGTIPSGSVKGSVVTGVARVQVQGQVVELKLEGSVDEGKLSGRLIGAGLPPITFNANRVHEIYSIAYSPDGKMLASGGEDNLVRLWDITTGQQVRTFENHLKGVSAVVFTPDGKVLASGSKDATIKLWNVTTGEEMKTLSGHLDEIASLSFSPDGATLVSGSFDQTVKLWDLKTGQSSKSLTALNAAIHSVAYSADGQKIAIGSDDGTITLWDPAGGTRQVLAGHSKAISSVVFAPKQDLLFSASWDATVKVWQTGADYPLATLVSIDKDDWVVSTTSGLFDASAAARKLMHYVLGYEIVTLDQMKDSYYVPGLLQKVISRQALPKIELFAAGDLFPEAQYQQPKPGQTSFAVKLLNRGGGIGPAQVLVNGTEVISDARPAGFDPNVKEVTLTIDLSNVKQIIPGKENKVEVIARNASGWLSSKGSARGTQVVVVGRGATLTAPPELYGIVAGIGDYVDPKLQLAYSVKDAEDFARALEIGASKFLGRDKVHLRLLKSSRPENGTPAKILAGPDSSVLDATRENFAKVFAEFAGKAKQNDLLVVYLSGHGLAVTLQENPGNPRGDTYLYLTREAKTTDDRQLANEMERRATTISGEELSRWIKDIGAPNKALVLDTCAAGAAAESLRASKDAPPDEVGTRAMDRLKDKTGFFILMGSAGDKVSYEATPYRQGLLTYALLEALKGAKLDGEGYAIVSDLFTYAQNRVPLIARKLGLSQQPQYLVPEVANPFPFGQYTADEQKLFSLPSPSPLILRPVLLNISGTNSGTDDLELQPIFQTVLVQASNVRDRGGDQVSLVFVDASQMSDAFTPSGFYSVSNNQVTIKLNLIRNKRTVSSLTVEGPVTDAQSRFALIHKLVEAMNAEIRKLTP